MERFLGAWKLASFEDRVSAEEISHPYGIDPVGLLIYDRSGQMSVQIMKRNRTAPSGALADAPAADKTAIEGFTAFFGTFEVDPGAGTVTHHVVGHVLPLSVGKRLERSFEFSGDLLILRPSKTRTVVWQRVS